LLGYMLGAGMVLAALALTYTTPWDNYLVYKGIWSYPQGRVLMSLGWVPVEEYSFFVIQTAFTCLWFLTVLERQVREARAGGWGEGADTACTWVQAYEGDVVCSFCLSLI
jgi:lycopene cyclase domain-containing protein